MMHGSWYETNDVVDGDADATCGRVANVLSSIFIIKFIIYNPIPHTSFESQRREVSGAVVVASRNGAREGRSQLLRSQPRNFFRPTLYELGRYKYIVHNGCLIILVVLLRYQKF